MTNNCKTIIRGVTNNKPHPHYWQSLVKDKRQCVYCNKYQFHDFEGWHFKLTEEED